MTKLDGNAIVNVALDAANSADRAGFEGHDLIVEVGQQCAAYIDAQLADRAAFLAVKHDLDSLGEGRIIAAGFRAYVNMIMPAEARCDREIELAKLAYYAGALHTFGAINQALKGDWSQVARPANKVLLLFDEVEKAHQAFGAFVYPLGEPS